MSDISPVGPGGPGMVPAPGPAPGMTASAVHRPSLNGHQDGPAVDAAAKAESPSGPQRPPDRVELSDRALYLDSILTSQEIRQDRVAAARQLIEGDDYPSDEQVAIAIDRMVAKWRD